MKRASRIEKRTGMVFLLVGALVLSGCSQSVQEKPDFIIETKTVSDFGQEVRLTKPGRIAGMTDLVVTSQVSGRIGKVLKKDGDRVFGGQPVLAISDTIANYEIQAKRAKNTFDRTVLQYQQGTVSLEKSLSDAATALEVAENTYEVTQKMTDQTLKKADLDHANSFATANGLREQLVLEQTTLATHMGNVLHQVDTYLGVSDAYKQYNDSYEIYLGAKNTLLKDKTEDALLALYTLSQRVKSFSTENVSDAQLDSGVVLFAKGYTDTLALLSLMKDVFVASIDGVALPKSAIDGYKVSLDGLSSAVQGSRSAFLAYRKQIDALLSPAGISGAAVDISVAGADISYQTTLINTKNSVFGSEIGVRNAQSLYTTLASTKDEQLGLLRNGVVDAQLSYQDALTRYNKLSVRAPLDGVIGTVLVDPGQEVAPGTPLFSFVSSQNQMIEIYLTADEVKNIKIDQYAKVVYAGDEFTGSVLSLSSVADKNTLYKVIIGLDRAVDSLGDVATVELPIHVSTSVLPLNIITPISADKGFIWVLEGTGIQKVDVVLGRVWNEYVQLSGYLSSTLQIITSDVSNFDPEKFVLKK